MLSKKNNKDAMNLLSEWWLMLLMNLEIDLFSKLFPSTTVSNKICYCSHKKLLLRRKTV